MIFSNSKIQKNYIIKINSFFSKKDGLKEISQEQYAIIFIDIDELKVDFIMNHIKYFTIEGKNYPKIVSISTKPLSKGKSDRKYDQFFIKPFEDIQIIIQSIIGLLE